MENLALSSDKVLNAYLFINYQDDLERSLFMMVKIYEELFSITFSIRQRVIYSLDLPETER